jgi:hypothetical protein
MTGKPKRTLYQGEDFPVGRGFPPRSTYNKFGLMSGIRLDNDHPEISLGAVFGGEVAVIARSSRRGVGVKH